MGDSLFCSQPIRDSTEWQWFVVDILVLGRIHKIEIQNRYTDKDTLRAFKVQVSRWTDRFERKDAEWCDVQSFESQQNSAWQTFAVDAEQSQKSTSRFWRIV